MSAELDRLAAVVHGGAAGIHAKAAIDREISPELAGAVRAYHLLGLFYNLGRGQHRDVAAHIIGFVVARRRSRVAHALVAYYDTRAAISHGRAAWEAR